MPSTQKKGTAKKRRRSVKPAGNREIWAVVLGLFAVFLFIGFFTPEAVFLGAAADFFRGLFGFGFYLIPPAMLFCTVYLFVKLTPADRVRRVVCLILLPWIVGMFGHLITVDDPAFMQGLYNSGKDLLSGGLFSGFTAASLVKLLSVAGAYIVVSILLLLSVLYALGITFGSFLGVLIALAKRIGEGLAELAKRRAQRVEEEPEIPVPAPQPALPTARGRGKVNIDIPLDGEPSPQSASVFDRREDAVLTADEIKAGDDEEYIPGVGDLGPEDDAVTLNNVFDALSEGELRDYNEDGKIDTTDEIQAYGRRIEKAVEASKSGERKPYVFPPIELLREDQSPPSQDAAEEVRANARRLREMLHDFNIEAKVINVTRGPSVTRYELQLSKGVKFSKMTGLSDDIALALGAQAVRIAPIPDKIAVGVEVPNKNISIVYLRDIITAAKFGQSGGLSFALGKEISGEPIVGDISKLPHMLVAGTTGSGKSVCINSLIVSILYRYTPEEVQLLMIDPKIIELGVYNGIPHLIVPVVVDPKKAASALGWAVTEMMRRYKLFSEAGVRNLADYNAALTAPDSKRIPQMVIVIDELADLMLVAAKEVEEYICRIAQMARAAGMHLIIATQRPSTDVITGLMKANIPSRIAFAVASQLESRIILDQMGAEKLIGKGDMLFNPIGSTKPVRIQGCFISSAEVESVVDYIKQNSSPEYSEEVLEHMDKPENQPGGGKSGEAAGDLGSEEDSMLEKAIELVVEQGMASTSFLQRRLKLGYPRAVRIMDMMEERGIVGPYEGSKPRAVLISKQQYQEMRFRAENLDK